MQTQELWNTRAGFILAAAGSAVGLGNIWRFPYVTGENGGGAFLVIYLGLAFTIGLTVLLAELAIGRATRRDPAGAFRVLHGGVWTTAGYLGIAAAFVLLSFYSVVGGWTFAYVVKAVTGSLAGASAETAEASFEALSGDPLQPVLYHAVFMVLTTAIVAAGVGRGIERASKLLMPAFFVILVILIGRALTLPGAMDGLRFYLTPDFSEVTPATVTAALSQAFFSLSIGMGAMITYGSYLASQHSHPRSALWITAIDTGVAVFAGLLIFPVVFAFGHDPAAGPGLTFVTLPTVFERMTGGGLFAAAFFLLLGLAALTSAVSLLAVPVANFVYAQRLDRVRASILLGLVVFLLGVPSSLSLGVMQEHTLFGLGFMDLMETLAIKIMLPVGGILIALFTGWVAYPRLVQETLRDGQTSAPWQKAWSLFCRFIAPAAILWVLIAGL